MSFKIISGGQTGVDRAALDVALHLSIRCGGWCPKGRLAEDGVILPRYPLEETSSAKYEERTRLNVQDSDAVLILSWGEVSGGTKLTLGYARKFKKPVLVLDLKTNNSAVEVREWLRKNAVNTLDVAGPRSSTHEDVYGRAYSFLLGLFSELVGP